MQKVSKRIEPKYRQRVKSSERRKLTKYKESDNRPIQTKREVSGRELNGRMAPETQTKAVNTTQQGERNDKNRVGP